MCNCRGYNFVIYENMIKILNMVLNRDHRYVSYVNDQLVINCNDSRQICLMFFMLVIV